MCGTILVTSLVGLCPMFWPAPAHGESAQSSAPASSVRMMATDVDERPEVALSPDTGGWLIDLLMDRLTVPLEPDIWPLGSGNERWLIADSRDGRRADDCEGEAQPQPGFLSQAGNQIVLSPWAARIGMRATTRVSETAVLTGEDTCAIL